MLKVELSGTPDEVLKAEYVIGLIFEGVARKKRKRTKRTMRLALAADALPGNNALLALLKMADEKEIG